MREEKKKNKRKRKEKEKEEEEEKEKEKAHKHKHKTYTHTQKKVKEITQIFGKHKIYGVEEIRWFQYQLSRQSQVSDLEQNKLMSMREFVIAKVHYFCTTLDISRPFPSSETIPSKDYAWNWWLSHQFRDAGIGFCTPFLINGIAHEKNLSLPG